MSDALLPENNRKLLVDELTSSVMTALSGSLTMGDRVPS
jgi:hypothetical protein